MPGRAPYDVVRCPVGVVRDQPDTVLCPVEFTRIFTCEKQFVKIRKIEADFDSDVDKNTLAQDRKKTHSTCLLHVNHPQLLKQYIYFCIYNFWSLKVKYICKCNMFFCKNMSLLTDGSLTHKTSAGAPTGIVRCPDGHRPIC